MHRAKRARRKERADGFMGFDLGQEQHLIAVFDAKVRGFAGHPHQPIHRLAGAVNDLGPPQETRPAPRPNAPPTPEHQPDGRQLAGDRSRPFRDSANHHAPEVRVLSAPVIDRGHRKMNFCSVRVARSAMTSQNPIFIPGPTNIPEEMRKAVDMPTIDHRSPVFGRMLHPALDGVKQVLKTTQAQVFLFPSTGTGGWETAITNTLSPGDKVLAARNGMFSLRWIDMCQRHGLDVTIVETPWGEGIPADRFEEILTADKGHEIRVVLATHNETATGVKSDIAAVRRALDAAGHPALLFVDGVSSIGSMDFRMDEWGVDIAVTGSQKGFMLPPGLAITAFSPKAMAAVETARLPRTFFDIRDMASGYARNGYPYTPPVGLINGLNLACRACWPRGWTMSLPATPASPAACARRSMPGASALRRAARALLGQRQRHPHARGL
jgi:phosphoserine aminotransferase